MECGSAFATGLIGGIVYQGGDLGGTPVGGQQVCYVFVRKYIWTAVWAEIFIVQLHATAHYQLPLHTCKSISLAIWSLQIFL